MIYLEQCYAKSWCKDYKENVLSLIMPLVINDYNIANKVFIQYEFMRTCVRNNKMY